MVWAKSNTHTHTHSLTHPDGRHPRGQRGHGVTVAGTHDGAVGADELLLGAAEPVQFGLVFYAEFTFPGEDSRLVVGGGQSHRVTTTTTAETRLRAVQSLLPGSSTTGHHSEDRLFTLHVFTFIHGVQSLPRFAER